MTDPILDEAVGAALEGLEEGLDPLAVGKRLRRLLPPELARRAAELHDLRRRARHKLADAERLYLTRRALEQASHRAVARSRAERIAGLLPGARVLDATAGIGGDSIELARAGLIVIAGDRDPNLVRFLRANLHGRGSTLAVRMDACWPPARTDVLLLDPDRRGETPRGTERRGDPETWSPSWSEVRRLLSLFEGACVKLAPAVEVEPLEQAGGLPERHAWRWTSLRGELKEASLWTGSLAEDPAVRSAVLLDGRGRENVFSAAPRTVPHLPTGAAEGVAWIADPDPAVIRSGLLGALATAEGLRPLGPDLAYLGGAEPPRSPFLKALRVLGSSEADPRRVRALLGSHGIGPVQVRKRGHPDAPEKLARKLKGPGEAHGVLVVARLAEGHRAYLVEPVSRPR